MAPLFFYSWAKTPVSRPTIGGTSETRALPFHTQLLNKAAEPALRRTPTLRKTRTTGGSRYSADGPDATVKITKFDVYEIAKCSEELIGIVVLAKVPLTLGAARTVSVVPTAGTKPLSNGAASVPPKVAVPGEPSTCNWLNCEELIGKLRVPAELCA